MMTFRVVILPRAEADIESNARWWAMHHSVEQAVRWFDTVHQQLKLLAQLPERNSLSIENDEFPYEIRDKLVGVGPRLNSYRGPKHARTISPLDFRMIIRAFLPRHSLLVTTVQ